MPPENNKENEVEKQYDPQPAWILVPVGGPFIKIVRNATMWDRLRFNMAYDLIEMPICLN